MKINKNKNKSREVHKKQAPPLHINHRKSNEKAEFIPKSMFWHLCPCVSIKKKKRNKERKERNSLSLSFFFFYIFLNGKTL
jgi:hypothetical protein